uniref:Uncharacterized protein n=1 Tax=Arundo donax TaxID=35708 RepID=A0A0A9FKN1_ARUDO
MLLMKSSMDKVLALHGVASRQLTYEKLSAQFRLVFVGPV